MMLPLSSTESGEFLRGCLFKGFCREEGRAGVLCTLLDRIMPERWNSEWGSGGSEFFSRYFQIIITLFSEVVGKGKRVKLFVTLLSLICL